MIKLRILLAVVVSLVLLLIPLAVLADNAAESELAFNLEWGEGINANTVHNTWYANGRHWVSLVYEGDVWVTSTADYGASWDSSKLVDTGNTSFYGLATWYDEPNDIVHMARVAEGNTTGNVTDIVYHSSYTPAASGLMATIEGEIAVEDGTYVDGDVISLAIACDEKGYPWIAWAEEEFPFIGNMTGNYWIETSNSDTNDGTWVETSAYGWYEFDSSGAAPLGHDYDTLYGAGNWTAIAVSLCPVSATGDLMQLAWSIENTAIDGDGDAGIDATIWNEDDGGNWGNLTWVVPMHDTQGLYPYTIGEIAFSFYDSGSTIYAVYCDWIGHIMYNFKEALDSWDDVSGYGNWTMIAATSGNIFPAIAGYNDPGVGEDLIVVYHDQDSLYYDTRPYGGSFTGTWTEIWDIDDHGVDPSALIFLHSLQYKYGADSPVGFAWDYGTLEWEPDLGLVGTIGYWWIDEDGGANPLGWYQSGVVPSTWLTVLFKTLLDLAIACGIVIGTLKFEMGWQPKLVMIAMGLMLIAVVNSLL